MTPLEGIARLELAADRKSADTLLVKLSGNWRAQASLPGVEAIERAFKGDGGAMALEFDASGLGEWDSRFVAFISKCSSLCVARKIEFRADGLPKGVRGLLRLASAVPEIKDARRAESQAPFLQRVGEGAMAASGGARDLFTFLGENVLALINLFRGRAQFRWQDALLVIQECGPQALGIVALINFLI